MVKVSVEVRNGVARLSVAVRAACVERAMSLVGERYPKGDVRVRLLKEPAACSRIVAVDRPDTAPA